jgi:tRNA nucleotidyltransferase (CCA-adding enzyme)
LRLNAFVVGGAVRDELLGLPVQDRDWVVVGSTPESMLALGFRPVGKDFPVFIHPENGEEYALARTERKTAKGYHGFSFHASADVTLEEDLSRRDLTINAIAKAADGSLIDPYQGIEDLRTKTFRHVSIAFKEDPVRILRLARFAARFADFEVHSSTMDLMQAMVKDGEVDALVAERVWQEFAKGLMENTPSRMLFLLQTCRALPKLLVDVNDDELRTMAAQIDLAATQQLSLAQRFALLTQWINENRLNTMRLPADVAELAILLKNMAVPITDMRVKNASDFATLLQRCDVIRRPDRFAELLQALVIAKPVFNSMKDKWLRVAKAYQAVNAGEIASQVSNKNGPAINDAVLHARTKAIELVLK